MMGSDGISTGLGDWLVCPGGGKGDLQLCTDNVLISVIWEL